MQVLLAVDWRAQSCTEINSAVTGGSAHVSNLFIFGLEQFRYVSISFLVEILKLFAAKLIFLFVRN